MIFRLTFLMVAILGCALLFSACQQDSLTEGIESELVQDTDNILNLRAPNILADRVERGRCCPPYKRRYVKITLDPVTHANYCSGGSALTYKFYNHNNPSDFITIVSSEAAPKFCLPRRYYALLISNNGVPVLQHNGTDFYVPTGQAGASSPIYNVDLRGSCGISQPTSWPIGD